MPIVVVVDLVVIVVHGGGGGFRALPYAKAVQLKINKISLSGSGGSPGSSRRWLRELEECLPPLTGPGGGEIFLGIKLRFIKPKPSERKAVAVVVVAIACQRAYGMWQQIYCAGNGRFGGFENHREHTWTYWYFALRLPPAPFCSLGTFMRAIGSGGSGTKAKRSNQGQFIPFASDCRTPGESDRLERVRVLSGWFAK